jgi:transcriptional regulator with XRE-family HTH domain
MDDLAEFRDKLKYYRERAGWTQQELARQIDVNFQSLSKRLHRKRGETLQRLDVERMVEKLAPQGAFRFKDQVREFLRLAHFEDLFEELALLPSINKLPETPPVATKPASKVHQQRETRVPDALDEARDRSEYLERTSRQFGTVTLPIGPGPLSFKA